MPLSNLIPKQGQKQNYIFGCHQEITN